MSPNNEIPATWPNAVAAATPSVSTYQTVPLALSAAQKLLWPLGAVLFDYLFWMERGGLNMLVFTIFIVVAQLWMLPRHAAVRRSGYFWLAVAGSLFSAGMMAVYGSAVAAVACLASVTMVLGYVNQPHLKLLLFAGLTAAGSVLQAGVLALSGLRFPRHGGQQARRGWSYARLLGLPLGFLVVFHGLFAVANPQYNALSSQVLATLKGWLMQLWPDISVPHLLFFAFGFLLTAGALVVVPVYFWADKESRFGEFVRRQRDRVASLAVRNPDFSARLFRPLDLRKEWLMALAAFALLNLLLLVVNIIDINWLWFGFTPEPGFDLAQFVHEGTHILIFSILLAMGIVLWYFRRNLNFYAPGLPWLRWGATVWVLQNAVLATSVAFRNYYYILYSGLAYKRIGVCFFLLLVLFGLGTVLLKIWQRRSAYALVRLNALAVYAVLLLLAAGNWEIWIARYNLQPRFQHIDVGFLLAMPGRVLPTLLERREVLNQVPALTIDTDDGPSTMSAPDVQRLLDKRVADWRARYNEYTHWQGQNYANWSAHQALKGKH